jgi:hypothetical protein
MSFKTHSPEGLRIVNSKGEEFYIYRTEQKQEPNRLSRFATICIVIIFTAFLAAIGTRLARKLLT